jgi:hypothetical protein
MLLVICDLLRGGPSPTIDDFKIYTGDKNSLRA